METNIFWSQIGSGFEEPGGTSPPRIPRTQEYPPPPPPGLMHRKKLPFDYNSPRSMYKNSDMTPRLSGHFSIFGLVFFVLKSLLGVARQWSREQFAILTLKPRSHVRILIYRTWTIGEEGQFYWKLSVCLLAKADRLSVVALHLVSFGVSGRGNQRRLRKGYRITMPQHYVPTDYSDVTKVPGDLKKCLSAKRALISGSCLY